MPHEFHLQLRLVVTAPIAPFAGKGLEAASGRVSTQTDEVGGGVGVWVGALVGVGVEVGPDTFTSVSVSHLDSHVPPPDKSAVPHTAVFPPAIAVTVVE